MDPSYQPFDWQQMFFGDAEALFLVEIVVRSIFIYVFALLMVRLMRKRGMAHLTSFEFIIIVALGSAVGDPMLYPEVPLVYGFVVIATVVLMQRLLSSITRRPAADRLVAGEPVVVVERGTLNLANIERERFAIAEVMELLRMQGIARLEEIELAVIEDAGRLSVLRRDQAPDGERSEIWALGDEAPSG